jgi:chromosome segregation ATPase
MNAKKDGAEVAVPAAVRSLLEKRSTFGNWLALLDDVGQQYRPEVAERVRADYEARLSEVARELESRRGTIETSLGEHRALHGQIATRFEDKSAEIEEVELRFQVGELDEATWTQRRQEHIAGLESIEAELVSAAGSVQELETILADLDGTSGERSAPMPSITTLVVEPVGTEPDVVEAEPEVVEAEPEPDHAEAEPVQVEEETEAEQGDDEFLDELAFLESLSLDDADSFDAVSRMLEEDETAEGEEDAQRADR